MAKPDGRDMSVTEMPFNWDAQLDVRRLKVGILQESFDEITNASAKANAEAMLQVFRLLGDRVRASPGARRLPASAPSLRWNRRCSSTSTPDRAR
ncbi:MAG: hypothetical protein R2712_19290 [Vicinamibacterales bacterium]